MLPRALHFRTVASIPRARVTFTPITVRKMSQKTLFQAIKEDHEEVCH